MLSRSTNTSARASAVIPDNFKTIQALLQIAEIFGTSLVAEGIEHEDDLRVLRDLGITYGQGYLIGRPSADVFSAIRAQAVRGVAGFPGGCHAGAAADSRLGICAI